MAEQEPKKEPESMTDQEMDAEVLQLILELVDQMLDYTKKIRLSMEVMKMSLETMSLKTGEKLMETLARDSAASEIGS